MSKKNELALFGGEKAVTVKPQEKWEKINQDVKDAVNKLMDVQIASIGNGSGVIGEFEDAFSKMTGSKYALAMNSGTSTLHSAYFAVDVGPGDEVIVPTYTWHATITPILHCGATPVFCDIDPETLTISPEDIERKITPRTKAISIVHVWGNVCHMDKILAIVKKHGIALIEDCSHAHGAKYKGRPVGSMGAVGCFSMQGGKAVSGGEAGVAVTDDPDIFDKMVLLGHFGRKKVGSNKEIHNIGDMSLGAKYRPQAWAIAMANVELKRLPELDAMRTKNYAILNDELRGCPGLELVDALPGCERSGYLEFKFKLTRDILKTVDKEKIVEAMQAEDIPIDADRYSSFNYTYGLLHTAPLFTTFDLRSIGGCFYDPTRNDISKTPVTLPVAEDVASRLLGMYAYADTDENAIRQMANGIRKVMESVEHLDFTS